MRSAHSWPPLVSVPCFAVGLAATPAFSTNATAGRRFGLAILGVNGLHTPDGIKEDPIGCPPPDRRPDEHLHSSGVHVKHGTPDTQPAERGGCRGQVVFRSKRHDDQRPLGKGAMSDSLSQR